MNTAEQKIDLIQKIARLDNPSLVDEIQRLIDFDSETADMKLTPEQNNRIHEAKEEYRSGGILSEAEANGEIEEWLRK